MFALFGSKSLVGGMIYLVGGNSECCIFLNINYIDLPYSFGQEIGRTFKENIFEVDLNSPIYQTVYCSFFLPNISVYDSAAQNNLLN